MTRRGPFLDGGRDFSPGSYHPIARAAYFAFTISASGSTSMFFASEYLRSPG
jgi:hypothetical protein